MKNQTPSTEGSGHKMRLITGKSVHGFRRIKVTKKDHIRKSQVL